jgi:hypothetical protein
MPIFSISTLHGRFTDEQRKGVFPPEILVGDDATPHQRLLAYTGARPELRILRSRRSLALRRREVRRLG